MAQHSIFLAIRILDRFLSLQKIDMKEYPCLCIVCASIAQKCQDKFPLLMKELLLYSREPSPFTKEDVKKMEAVVLRVLDYKLMDPTLDEFLLPFQEYFIEILSEDQKNKSEENLISYVEYISYISLYEISSYQYIPSLLATCCLYKVAMSLGYSWDSRMDTYTRHSIDSDEVKLCLSFLNNIEAMYPKEYTLKLREVPRLRTSSVDQAYQLFHKRKWSEITEETHNKTEKTAVLPQPQSHSPTNMVGEC